jgi:hypothetical protein
MEGIALSDSLLLITNIERTIRKYGPDIKRPLRFALCADRTQEPSRAVFVRLLQQGTIFGRNCLAFLQLVAKTALNQIYRKYPARVFGPDQILAIPHQPTNESVSPDSLTF